MQTTSLIINGKGKMRQNKGVIRKGFLKEATFGRQLVNEKL